MHTYVKKPPVNQRQVHEPQRPTNSQPRHVDKRPAAQRMVQLKQLAATRARPEDQKHDQLQALADKRWHQQRGLIQAKEGVALSQKLQESPTPQAIQPKASGDLLPQLSEPLAAKVSHAFPASAPRVSLQSGFGGMGLSQGDIGDGQLLGASQGNNIALRPDLHREVTQAKPSPTAEKTLYHEIAHTTDVTPTLQGSGAPQVVYSAANEARADDIAERAYIGERVESSTMSSPTNVKKNKGRDLMQGKWDTVRNRMLTKTTVDEDAKFEVEAEVVKNPNIRDNLLSKYNESNLVNVYSSAKKLKSKKELENRKTIGVGTKIWIDMPVDKWIPYSDSKGGVLEGYLYINNIFTKDAEYNRNIALNEQGKREVSIMKFKGSDLITLQELKAHYNMLIHGNASTDIDGGVFWSGDTFTGDPDAGTGAKYKTYQYDSMLSGHEFARAFHFKSLEMTDGGYSAESHLLFQELRNQLKKLQGLFNWETLINLRLFSDISIDEEGKLQGFDSGRWWDSISTRFAEQQTGLVWCVHATDFHDYWKTTLELVTSNPPVNVTWFNKEYPALINKLGDPKEQGMVHGIVEVYKDRVTVSTAKKHQKAKDQVTPKQFYEFNNIKEFLNSPLHVVLAGERGESLKGKIEAKLTSKNDDWFLKAPDADRAGAAKNKKIISDLGTVGKKVDVRTGEELNEDQIKKKEVELKKLLEAIEKKREETLKWIRYREAVLEKSYQEDREWSRE